MNIQTFLMLYVLSAPVFILADILWLGVIASSFYRNRVGHLMEISWWAAVVFYVIFLAGITYFATYPAVDGGGGVRHALLLGALFGFFTYATYDLTNLATLKDWPVDMSVVDILWGTFLGACVAGITSFLYLTFVS